LAQREPAHGDQVEDQNTEAQPSKLKLISDLKVEGAYNKATLENSAGSLTKWGKANDES
jgi:hypothetical protein